MNLVTELQLELRALGTAEKAKASARFFKTGPGQYGEGDVFIGVTVPEQRKVAKKYRNLSLIEAEKLMLSPIHEERLIALLILIDQFKRAETAKRREIYEFYLSHTDRINNWDLVDSSASYIVGPYLPGNLGLLKKMAKSDLIWDRRIAMLATFYSINESNPKPAFEIAEILINDSHDLIQKVVGWMLREVGKRCSREIEEAFLLKHYKTMPRTSLRYAIEHFETSRRKAYLAGTVDIL